MLVSLPASDPSEGSPLLLPFDGYAPAEQLHQAAVDPAAPIQQFPGQPGFQEG